MKLIKGKGSPNVGACWMSAIAWYEGNKKWTDTPDCVCPIIQAVGILANDWMPDNETREREIGPVLFDVVGTAAPHLCRRRAEMVLKHARAHMRLAFGGWTKLLTAETQVGQGHYGSAVAIALSAMWQNRATNQKSQTQLALGLRDLALELARVGEQREVPQRRSLEELPS